MDDPIKKARIIEQRKKRLEHIQSQYEERILLLLNGRQKEQLVGREKEIYEILIQSSMFDPRRPDVGYGTEAMVIRGYEISAKLNTLSPKQFLTDNYVIEWRAHLGEGMKINNLPLDN